MTQCGHPTRAGWPCRLTLAQGLDRCTIHAEDALTRMGVQAACLARRDQITVWRNLNDESPRRAVILVTVPHARVTQRAPAGIKRWGARQLTCEARPSLTMRNGEWFWTVDPFVPAATVFELADDEALVLADRLMAEGHDIDAHRVIKAVTGVDPSADAARPPARPPAPKTTRPTPWTRAQMLLFSSMEDPRR